MFGVPRSCHSASRITAESTAFKLSRLCTTERDHDAVVSRSLSRHDAIGTRTGESRFDVGGGPPGWRQVVGEHRGHEPLESRALLFVDAPFGEHSL